jgi:hypothetical protein
MVDEEGVPEGVDERCFREDTLEAQALLVRLVHAFQTGRADGKVARDVDAVPWGLRLEEVAAGKVDVRDLVIAGIGSRMWRASSHCFKPFNSCPQSRLESTSRL